MCKIIGDLKPGFIFIPLTVIRTKALPLGYRATLNDRPGAVALLDDKAPAVWSLVSTRVYQQATVA